MFNFKSPYLWLSISLTCAALALGLLPTLIPDAAFADKPETVTVDRFVETAPTATLPQPVSDDDSKIFKIVDRMPLFPGADCGDIKDFRERKACADKALLEYVYATVEYPDHAKESGVEGMAVVSFVVEKNGVVSNITVVRDPGAKLGAEAANVVRKMREDNFRWEPGLADGKPVRVQFNLPVKFKLK